MKINDAFVLRNIYGKYILMPVRTNSASNDPILLNEVAVSIWNAVDMYQQKDQIVSNLQKQYDLETGSPEIVSIERFIDQMYDMGLLIN